MHYSYFYTVELPEYDTIPVSFNNVSPMVLTALSD